MAAQALNSHRGPFYEQTIFHDGSPDMYQNYDYSANTANDFSGGDNADYDGNKADSGSEITYGLKKTPHKKEGYDYDNDLANERNNQESFDTEMDRHQEGKDYRDESGFQDNNNQASFKNENNEQPISFNEDANTEEGGRSYEDLENLSNESYENGNGRATNYQTEGGEGNKGKEEELVDYDENSADLKSNNYQNHFPNSAKNKFRANPYYIRDFQDDSFFTNQKPNFGPNKRHNPYQRNQNKKNKANLRYNAYNRLHLRSPLNQISAGYLYQPQYTQDTFFTSLDTTSPFTSSFIQPQTFGPTFVTTFATPQYEEYFTNPQFTSQYFDYKVITRK